MPESDPAAEKELGRLRRLPENRICPNCLKEERLGFMAVCVRFRTFVCSDCKSAHQSFSHRCKDAAQSAWQMAEVRELDERKGGGNKAACRRWLANVPDGERPTESSSLDAFKRFVERAYIEERWAGTEEAPAPAAENGAEGVGPAQFEDGEVPSQRHRRHHKDSAGEDAGRGGRRRRRRSRRRERAAEEPAAGWGAPGWPEVEASEGPPPFGQAAGIPGWQSGPVGPIFEMAPPASGENAFGGAHFGQGPAAPWIGSPASGSSPVNRAWSDAQGWQTPSNSTTDRSVYASPSAKLSFSSLFAEASLQLKASVMANDWNSLGRGLPAVPADPTNPWADAPDLPIVSGAGASVPSSNASGSNDLSPMSLRAARRPWGPSGMQPQNEDAESAQTPTSHLDAASRLMLAVDATNPWADEGLRPKAPADLAGVVVGKRPIIGF